jgi:hypothetical protein
VVKPAIVLPEEAIPGLLFFICSKQAGADLQEKFQFEVPKRACGQLMIETSNSPH